MNEEEKTINSEDMTREERAKKNEEIREQMRRQIEEEQRKLKDALEAMKEGKGRLELEKPILSGDKEIKELVYDFTELTGIDYTEAMDSSPNASQNLARMGYRQGLSLFAKAAAKQSEGLDMQDIVERIGATDAAEAVELANIFFSGSIRAGRKRISKK